MGIYRAEQPEIKRAMNSCLHRDAVANRKVGDIPGFQWYAFECVGPDIMFTGAVVVGTIERGPRKGRQRYSKETKRVVVTDAESDAEYVRFEAETGKCGDCKGDGKVFAGWHHVAGTSYRLCPKCHGAGTAELATSVAAVDPHADSTGKLSTRV